MESSPTFRYIQRPLTTTRLFVWFFHFFFSFFRIWGRRGRSPSSVHAPFPRALRRSVVGPQQALPHLQGRHRGPALLCHLQKLQVHLRNICYFYYFIFISALAGPPGAARDYFTISLWKSPVQIDLRTLRALGWGEPPTNKIFIFKPTPRSNFCLLAPAQFSKHTPPFGRVDPAGPRFGWAPHK